MRMRVGWGWHWSRIAMVVAGLTAVVALVAACGANTEATPTPNILAQPIGTLFVVASPAGTPLAGEAGEGQKLFVQFHCNTCHGDTGQGGVGPKLAGLPGSQVTLDNGQTVTADDAYLTESIENPDAKIVKGFSKGVMAAGVGGEESQIQADDNVAKLIAFIKALK